LFLLLDFWDFAEFGVTFLGFSLIRLSSMRIFMVLCNLTL
jgi:hypothetical protein